MKRKDDDRGGMGASRHNYGIGRFAEDEVESSQDRVA
jgi:hypothetical protein